MDGRSPVPGRRQAECIPVWTVVLLVAAAFIAFGLKQLQSGFGQQPETQPFNSQVGSRDWPQLGGGPSRNNAVETASLPTEWDIATGCGL